MSPEPLKRYARPIILYHYVVWEYLKNFALALVICALVFLLAAASSFFRPARAAAPGPVLRTGR
jgi:hypothetical protein